MFDGGVRGYKHVQTGFSLGAAIFGPLWAIWRGSLALTAGFSLGALVVHFLPQWLSLPQSPLLSRTLVLILSASYIAILGMCANTWYRMAVEADGYKLIGLTHMRHPIPPAEIGDLVSQQYAVVSWPADTSPSPSQTAAQHAEGYLIAQHSTDASLWYLIPTDGNWSPLDTSPARSLEEAKTLTEAQAPSLRDHWRSMPTSHAPRS